MIKDKEEQEKGYDLQELYNFVDWLNEEVAFTGMDTEVSRTFGQSMQQSMERHYVEDRQRNGVRMSNLGKPAMILAFNKLGYTEPEPIGKSRMMFMTGDFFENAIEALLQTYGIKILNTQGEVEHLGVSGHYDYLVELDGQPVLLEAKTMSDYYAKAFDRFPNDERGYVTQLAMYKAALGIDLAAWVCLNKGNGLINVVEPMDDTIFDDALKRAGNVLHRLDKVENVTDITKLFNVPPQKAEVYKGDATGKYLVPVQFKFSPFKDVILDVSTDTNGYNKDTEYVNGVNSPELMEAKLEEKVKNGELIYSM